MKLYYNVACQLDGDTSMLMPRPSSPGICWAELVSDLSLVSDSSMTYCSLLACIANSQGRMNVYTIQHFLLFCTIVQNERSLQYYIISWQLIYESESNI